VQSSTELQKLDDLGRGVEQVRKKKTESWKGGPGARHRQQSRDSQTLKGNASSNKGAGKGLRGKRGREVARGGKKGGVNRKVSGSIDRSPV